MMAMRKETIHYIQLHDVFPLISGIGDMIGLTRFICL